MPSTLSTLLFLAATTTAAVLPRTTPPQVATPQVIVAAGGGPPNTPPPTNLSDTGTKVFQAVNFLENMESAFFLEGLVNLTSHWSLPEHKRKHAIDVISKVQAQELVHVQVAENILTANNKPTFEPCTYSFPATTPEEFLSLANIIGSVGVGAVINVAATLATSDPELVGGPASILAVEARHDAFFRAAAEISDIPNPAPFDTRISAGYALNLANPFLVHCAKKPDFALIPPMKMKALPHAKPVTGSNGPIVFTIDASAKVPSGKVSVGWVNQANKVVYTDATVSGKEVKTEIPAGLAGLAFAALTGQEKALDVNSLTAVTVAGPAPVQIS